MTNNSVNFHVNSINVKNCACCRTSGARRHFVGAVCPFEADPFVNFSFTTLRERECYKLIFFIYPNLICGVLTFQETRIDHSLLPGPSLQTTIVIILWMPFHTNRQRVSFSSFTGPTQSCTHVETEHTRQSYYYARCAKLACIILGFAIVLVFLWFDSGQIDFHNVRCTV